MSDNEKSGYVHFCCICEKTVYTTLENVDKVYCFDHYPKTELREGEP